MPKQKAAPRQMDELGRILIPADIREVLEWGVGTKLEISVRNSKDSTVKAITIKEVAPCCSLCRKKSGNLEKIEKGYMCPDCLIKIRWAERPT